MRLIVRNRQPLHTWSVKEYIKQTQANLTKQETSKYITMQNIFRKLYLRHLEDHQKLQALRRDLTNHVLISPTPARTIAEYFHQKAKFYSEDFMTATFTSIASAYQISKADNGGSLDSTGYQLFLTSEFSNLSEQLKYALRNNKLGFANLVSVAESLLKLEYVDYEIINLLILYTKREINGEDPNTILRDWKGDREFQIEKKNYYDPAEFDTLKTLRESKEVSTALSFVKHIYKESMNEKSIRKDAEVQGIQLIQSIIEEISQTNKNFRQVVEGIINLRKEYLKMVEFSENEQILRNPSLNLELLELEEKLMAIKLINIEDIKDPKSMKDSKYEVRRVEEIILAVLNFNNLTPIVGLIGHNNVQVFNQRDNYVADPAKVATLLNILAKFSSLDRFVYYTADGKSLLTLKWEKTLVEQQPGMQITTGSLHEELNVSRIYRRVYSDILQVFNQNQEKITNIFKHSHLKSKIELYDAYCRVGLNQIAILNISAIENTSSVKQLSSSEFSTLVHLLNDIGIFIGNPTIKRAVYNRLSQDLTYEESNQLNLSLRSTIDAVNYLLQNHRESKGFINVYNRYIQLLELKSVYLTVQKHDHDLTVEAFKILALERPEKYGSHPVYLTYVDNLANSNYKKNPYLSILRETCYKWANKEHTLNSLQTYLNLGVSNGVQNGLIFSNSDETSLEGQIRSGDLNSYIIRLETQNGIKIHEFSINSFLNINFGSKNEKHFQLKPVEILKQRLDEVFERQAAAFEATYEQLKGSISKLFEFYPSSLITNRIIFKIAVLDKLRNNNSSIQTKEQEFTNKAEFLLEILELNKLLNLLRQNNIYSTVPKKQPVNFSLNQKLNKKQSFSEESDSITVDVPAMKNLMRQIKSTIPDLINQISEYVATESLQKSIQPTTKSLNLNGQRQSLEVLEQEKEKTEKKDKISFDLATEFINNRYYNDKTYCEYRDWKDRITKKYNLVELNYDSLSNLSKVLTNKFCSGLTNKVTLMPVVKHEQRIKRLNLDFKLLKDESASTSVVEHNEKSKDEELDYIINLQNFKHELKSTLSPQKLLNYIFGFKFVNDLLPRSEDRVHLLLHRDPVEYFNYLEELSERTYLESPFVQYIISKLSKTDKVRNLLQKRKEVRTIQRILYQKGEINSDTYYSRINEVQDEIIAGLTDLKEKMLDNMEDALLPGEFKMIQIKKEEFEAFEQIILRNFSYSRYFDQDFIQADGKYDVAINLKRSRAQSNFIKFSLLKKVLEKNQLTDKEKDLMKKWHDDIGKNVKSFVPQKEFTTLQISDLSWEDLQLLKLKSSTLNSNKNMLLIDLILELNNFLDESLIHAYEREVKADIIEKNFKIPAYLFSKSSSNSFKQLENETEEAILNEKSELTDAELNTLEEMFKNYKTEGLKERNRYNVLCINFKENLNQMNKQSLRNELIEEYVKHLEGEFLKEYNPALVKEIKDKETDKLWREVFRQPYESCSKELLKESTKKLIIRLEIVGDNSPPFFGNLLLNLLQHPNLDSLSKESLIAAIETTKFDLNLDSQDIEQISRREGRQTRMTTTVKQDLKASCARKIGKQLKERVQTFL